MSRGPSEAKDPTIALILALCLPGGGYAFVGRPQAALVVIGIFAVLFMAGWWKTLVVFHVLQAVASRGAAIERNRALSGDSALPVPPPVIRRTPRESASHEPPRREVPPTTMRQSHKAAPASKPPSPWGEPPAPRPAAPPKPEGKTRSAAPPSASRRATRAPGPPANPVSVSEFLDRVEQAHRDRESAWITPEAFDKAKADLLSRVHPQDDTERNSLLAATEALVGRGILLQDDRDRLADRHGDA